ncbi:MAG: hypothetical protein JWN76_2067 [Chitinophagaceae bacterium]|nr:hypothetical protein [Chitinophagaceae bacterium]
MEERSSILENVMSVMFFVVLSVMLYFVGGVALSLANIH